MKYLLYHLFIFLAGSDEELLSKCSTTERIKYALYGILILIPTISAFISMNYALSTFVDNIILIYLVSFAWGAAILTIDRFIVSTFHKDEKTLKNIFSLKLWIRLIFAISLGVIISHPITMLFFDESIAQQIELEHREKIDKSRKQREKEFQNSPLLKQLDSLNTKIQCETQLISAEYSGEKVQICGIYSSGKFGCGNRCKIREKSLAKLEDRRLKLEEKINAQKIEYKNWFTADSSSMVLRKDYITRVNALEVLKEKNPHMANVELAILLFFILLDLIPLIFKFSGERTEYDVLADKRRANMIESFTVESTNDIEVEKSFLNELKAQGKRI